MNERLIMRGKLQELRKEARDKAIRAGMLIERSREELALSAITKISDINLDVVKAAIDEAVLLREDIQAADRHIARLEAELGDKS